MLRGRNCLHSPCYVERIAAGKCTWFWSTLSPYPKACSITAWPISTADNGNEAGLQSLPHCDEDFSNISAEVPEEALRGGRPEPAAVSRITAVHTIRAPSHVHRRLLAPRRWRRPGRSHHLPTPVGRFRFGSKNHGPPPLSIPGFLNRGLEHRLRSYVAARCQILIG